MKIIQVNEDISIKRSVDSGTEEQREIVQEIIANVKNDGDAALYSLYRKI